MDPAPIVMCIYARPDYLRRTLESLAQNPLASESVLYAFCDGPREEAHREGCEASRRVVENATGFKDVVVKTFDKNRGPAVATVESVTDVINRHGKCVVIEEDIVSTPYFLTYLNEGLERYRDKQRVFTLCGYSPEMRGIPKDYPFDAFFSYRTMCWGWATWADRWSKGDWEIKDFPAFKRDRAMQERFNRGGADMSRMLIAVMEGRIVTWDVQWDFAAFKHDGLALLPVYSLVRNIGTDETGTNFTKGTIKFNVDLSKARPIERWPDAIEVDPRMARSFRAFHARSLRRGLRKAVNVVKGLVKSKST